MRLLLPVLLLGVLAGCMHSAMLNRGTTADDKEVIARNLAACRQQADVAKMSAGSPSYSRYVEECMRKGGIVESR